MIEGVYINLDSVADRRASMDRQLSALALPYPVRRFAAVDGRKRPGCPEGMLPGIYGCWLSHLQILRDAIGAPGHLHVMEDDAELSGMLARLEGMLALLDEQALGSWDLLYLDATLVEIPDMYEMFEWTQLARSKNSVSLKPIPRSFTVYGTHSYVVNARSKEKLLGYLNAHMAYGKPIDNALAHGIQAGELRAYVTAPFVTSNTDLGLKGAIVEGGDDRFLAWLIFRRLCFVTTGDDALGALQARLAPLVADTGRAESILGSLMAYRISRWPYTLFAPALKEKV